MQHWKNDFGKLGIFATNVYIRKIKSTKNNKQQ